MEMPLDEVRERIGLGFDRERTARSSLGRYLSHELSGRARWSLAGVAIAAAVVAVTLGYLVGGLADASGGPWSVARAVVSWPSPAQQILAAIACVALVTIALATGHNVAAGQPSIVLSQPDPTTGITQGDSEYQPGWS